METLQLFHVDAFASALFHGNPAAVCILEEALPDTLMQRIAAENNLAETAFVVRRGEKLELRWFTPTVEVDLCGHATLAAAHVLSSELGMDAPLLVFDTKSGPLSVRRGEPMLLDLPAFEAEPIQAPAGLIEALGVRPKSIEQARYWICELDDEEAVLAVRPDFRRLARLQRCVTVTARSKAPGIDFVSRFFAAPAGVDEDSVTGSAHAELTPYWSKRLGKTSLLARQLSKRGAELTCRLLPGRVELGGHCVTYLHGTLRLNALLG